MAAVKGEYKAQPAKRQPRGRDSSVSFVPFIVFIFFITQLGRVRRSLGVMAGGLLLPIFGSMILPFGLITLLLIPLGLVAGFILCLLGSALGAAGAASGRRGGGGFWIGGSGGGMSSGGFGGFSGGGGGFGGGGASGGW